MMKNDGMTLLFSLIMDPLAAGVILKCPGSGYGNDAQGNGWGCLFFMIVYAHGSVIIMLELGSTGVME